MAENTSCTLQYLPINANKENLASEMAIKLARSELILVHGDKFVNYSGWWLTPPPSDTSISFYSL